jgi:hypothetical protein
VVAFLDEHGFRYALIGGLAASCRGQARATSDIDLVVWVELGEEREIIEAVLERFRSRVEDPEIYSLHNRILLFEATNHVSVDLALASFPHEEAMIERATKFKFKPRLSAKVLTPEDLIVTKIIGGRDIDWFDIQGIFDRLGPKLDDQSLTERLKSISEMIDLEDTLSRLEVCRQKSKDLGDIELQ